MARRTHTNLLGLPQNRDHQQADHGIEPLLKWAGGKRALAKHIVPALSDLTGTYYEPFAGGAAIFFRLAPEKAQLSDINHELIECYQAIRDRPDELAALLRGMKNSEREYYRVRQLQPGSDLERAARFVYLTTLSFNGIYRQNLRGEFNVPYGHKVSKKLATIEQLNATSLLLRKAKLAVADFQVATHNAVAGDTIYFDPPYTVAHNNNGFVKYNKSIFSWSDQVRLAEHCEQLVAKGCRVVVSNADHTSIRELYPRFDVRVIHRPSVIAAHSGHRGSITECLFTSRGTTYASTSV